MMNQTFSFNPNMTELVNGTDLDLNANVSAPETPVVVSSSAISSTTTSKLLTTLLSKAENTILRTTQISTFDEEDVFIPSLDISKPKEHILERLMSNSRVISDIPEYMITPNTPLTAPEHDLVTVSAPMSWTYGSPPYNLGSAHTDELGWLIPAVIGALFVFIFLAALCYFGVRKLELKMMWCCFRTFGCCRPTSGTGSGDELAGSTSSMAAEQEMKAYKSHSAVDFN